MNNGEGILWQSVKSVWLRNATMYSKTWKLNILPNFFEPVFILIGLGLGVGFYLQQVGGVPYPVFLAPGLIAVSAMNGTTFESTYNVYVRMNLDRNYDSMLATPVNESEILCGEILWSITRALIYGGIFYLVTLLFGLIPSCWSPGILLVILLTGYLFAVIGITYAFTIPTLDLFSIYFTLFIAPLYIFSDTYFPLQARLGSWAWIAELNPLFHSVRLCRAFAMGHFAPVLIWDVIYILGVGFTFHALALKQFKKRIHQPAR